MTHKTFTDQMNRRVQLHWPPRQIISLVPSQTELLADLGLEEEVVGITKFCVHPERWFRNKTRVGGTKQYKMERIESLQPDLIIGNKEENDREQIEALSKQYPVWLSDIYTLEDALQMIRSIGELTDCKLQAEQIAMDIESGFDRLQEEVRRWPTQRVAYLIWRKPWMAVGQQTFIHHMLQRIGLINAFEDEMRYPAFDLEDLARKQVDLIYLSSEPFPFGKKHMEDIQQVCPNAQIQLVNGEAFSWYGSRLLQAPAYFKSLRGLGS